MELRLIPVDAILLAAFKDSPAAFAAVVKAEPGTAPDVFEPILEQTAAHLAAHPRPADFGCFLTADDAAGALVGTCGYKFAPAADGTIEISYFTFPAFEGRGYATSMATRLAADAGPRVVIAHTLPERNASCRVLEKAGFSLEGAVVDPDDGPVWRWKKIP